MLGPHAMTEKQRELAGNYWPHALILAKGIYGKYRALAKRYGLDLDEFTSSAELATCQAAQRFDPSRKVEFATYAAYRVRGACISLLRDHRPLGYRRREPGTHAVTVVPVDFALAERSAEAGDLIQSVRQAMLAESHQPSASLEREEDFASFLRVLPPRAAQVVRWHYDNELSQSEIAGRLGLCQSYISHVLRNSLTEIRARFAVAC